MLARRVRELAQSSLIPQPRVYPPIDYGPGDAVYLPHSQEVGIVLHFRPSNPEVSPFWVYCVIVTGYFDPAGKYIEFKHCYEHDTCYGHTKNMMQLLEQA